MLKRLIGGILTFSCVFLPLFSAPQQPAIKLSPLPPPAKSDVIPNKLQPIPEGVEELDNNSPTEIITKEPVVNDTEVVKEALDNFFDALKASDISKAYYGFTSKAFRKSVTPDQFRLFLKKYPGIYRHHTHKITNSSFHLQSSLIEGQILEGGELPLKFSIQLVMEDNEWKIQSLKLFPRTKKQ